MTKLSHREIAVSFLKLASGKVREAYSKYVSPNLRHHNPYFRGDRESLMLAMEENAAKNPNKKLEIKLSLEDRNLAATYSHVQQNPGDSGVAVVHIFRFEGREMEAKMRKIIASEMVTLDGLFSGANGEIDWFSWNEEMARYAIDLISTIDTLLFGRVTYDLMASYWPSASPPTEDPLIIDRMNKLKLVRTKTFSNDVVLLQYHSDIKKVIKV
jgi:predicted SnoaL-like aldol condensation-catalyzing enzyme